MRVGCTHLKGKADLKLYHAISNMRKNMTIQYFIKDMKEEP